MTHANPSIPELRALSELAALRAATYRRRLYVGRGQPGRLAELERMADGAASRLRRATVAAADARHRDPR